MAYLPLNADGTPVEGAVAALVPVKNEPVVDVTVPPLPEGASAYAVMFVNNKEYTLRPDDITIYTVGGQGDEEYDDGGFPEPSIPTMMPTAKLQIPPVSPFWTTPYCWRMKTTTVSSCWKTGRQRMF